MKAAVQNLGHSDYGFYDSVLLDRLHYLHVNIWGKSEQYGDWCPTVDTPEADLESFGCGCPITEETIPGLSNALGAHNPESSEASARGEADDDAADDTIDLTNDWRPGAWFAGDSQRDIFSVASVQQLIHLTTARTPAGKWLAKKQNLPHIVAPIKQMAEAELFLKLVADHSNAHGKVNYATLTAAFNAEVLRIIGLQPDKRKTMRLKTVAFLQSFHEDLNKRLKTEQAMTPVLGEARDLRRALRKMHIPVPEAMPLPPRVTAPPPSRTLPLTQDNGDTGLPAQGSGATPEPSGVNQTKCSARKTRKAPTCQLCLQPKNKQTGHGRDAYCPVHKRYAPTRAQRNRSTSGK
eukprot:scaffold114421_cov21-Prasinocladus_malaysianus.AAC.1